MFKSSPYPKKGFLSGRKRFSKGWLMLVPLAFLFLCCIDSYGQAKKTGTGKVTPSTTNKPSNGLKKFEGYVIVERLVSKIPPRANNVEPVELYEVQIPMKSEVIPVEGKGGFTLLKFTDSQEYKMYVTAFSNDFGITPCSASSLDQKLKSKGLTLKNKL